MIQFNFITKEQLSKHTNTRAGESKIGEKLTVLNTLEALSSAKEKFVIFGISEDIGVRANYGNPGARYTWEAFLSSFLNIQVNAHNNPESFLVLGNFTTSHSDVELASLKAEALSEIVTNIDTHVSTLVARIVAAGKIPIAIGGGHNNAYGLLKGTSEALQTPINCINIDAHTDLRTADRRHSGNGFTYAISKNYLKKYHIFGLHKNYTPAYIFKAIADNEDVSYSFYEDMKTSKEIQTSFNKELTTVAQKSFGLELDCDAIQDFPSSAQTPSGILMQDTRQLLIQAATKETLSYVHICEASAVNTAKAQVGKALSYFVSDIIRSYNAN